MKQITIGIPNSLLYYTYHDLWLSFFKALKIQVCLSPNTNKEIIAQGIKYSTDESCMALKIFLGHVKYLQDKCDYIFLPRLECIKEKEMVCTNFQALYDMVRNIFPAKILHYNINLKKNATEEKAFLQIGHTLGFSKEKVKKAYKEAREIANKKASLRLVKQKKRLKESKNIKILLAGHPYNLYDAHLGQEIASILQDNKVDVFYSDLYDKENTKYEVKNISEHNYWTFNREIMASISHYENKVDGIILVTSFPCGPDSLSNEMILRTVKKPITNIIFDEANADTGLLTRIESFIDILEERRKYEKRKNH